MVNKVKRAKFRGKTFPVKWCKLKGPDLGQYAGPGEGRYIAIDPSKNQEEFELLNTLIHEALHACYFDMDEDAVTEGADSIACFLFAVGWRVSN